MEKEGLTPAISLELKVNMNKADLIDAIASGSKLTKADAGKLIASEDTLSIKATLCSEKDGKCPVIEASFDSKTNI